MDGLFDGFARFTGAFLDAPQQFIFLALGEGEIAIGEFAPFLFQFTFGDVPVAFDFECRHNVCFYSPPM